MRHYATNRKVAGSIPDGVIAGFIDIFYGPEAAPNSNRNKHQAYFLGVKVAGV